MNSLPLAARLYVASLLAGITAVALALAPRPFALRDGYWMAAAAGASLYAAYRAYKAVLGRIEDEQRRVQELSDLNLATVEALALAIEAKDQIGQRQIQSRPPRCCATSASWRCPSTSSRNRGR